MSFEIHYDNSGEYWCERCLCKAKAVWLIDMFENHVIIDFIAVCHKDFKSDIFTSWVEIFKR